MVLTADLWDERGDELDSVSIPFRDFGAKIIFDGPVRTIRCHRDNRLIKETLATPGEGAVLVVDGGGALESALVGGNIAVSAVASGWSGVIIHGAVRDTDELKDIDLGIKALSTNPRTSAKEGVGETDVEITIGDVTFVPGNHVWVDADGIVTGPAS